MSYTVQQINDQIIAGFEAAFGQSLPLLPKSFLRVLAKTAAGVFITLHKYAGFTARQLFVATASDKVTTFAGKDVAPLSEWGNLVGADARTPATQAELTIDVTVTNQSGALAQGSQLVNAATGYVYATTAAVVLNAATVSATVRAVSDPHGGDGAGAESNMTAGQVLRFAGTPAGVSRDALVTASVVTGADAENVEDYRRRVLDRFSQRPLGGSAADYLHWARNVAGIKTAYPYASTTPGGVDVYIEASDGVPTGAQLQAVLDEINKPLNRPLSTWVTVFPIEPQTFVVGVIGLVVDDLAQVQADILAAVTSYMAAREPFIDGLSLLPRKDRVTRSAISGVVDDVVSAAGGVFTAVTLSRNAVGIELYILGQGEKAALGSVGYS